MGMYLCGKSWQRKEKEEGRRGRRRRRSKPKGGEWEVWVKVQEESRRKIRKDFNIELYMGKKEQFKFKF